MSIEKELLADKIYNILRENSPENKEEAYRLGMLRKEQLEDGSYYLGHCRNASVAKWNFLKNKFVYMRDKWGSHYAEDIVHIEDDECFDIFVPIEKVIPNENQIVKGESK
jgi:hypothetical protein